MNRTLWIFALVAVQLAGQVRSLAQPTPKVYDNNHTWGPWVLVASCGGVNYYFQTNLVPGVDDKHRAHVKVENTNKYDVKMGFTIRLISELGKVYEITGKTAQLNAGRDIDDGICVPFEDNVMIAQWGIVDCRVKERPKICNPPNDSYCGIQDVKPCEEQMAKAEYPFYKGKWVGKISRDRDADAWLNVGVHTVLQHETIGAAVKKVRFDGSLSPRGELKVRSEWGDMEVPLKLSRDGNSLEGSGTYTSRTDGSGPKPVKLKFSHVPSGAAAFAAMNLEQILRWIKANVSSHYPPAAQSGVTLTVLKATPKEIVIVEREDDDIPTTRQFTIPLAKLASDFKVRERAWTPYKDVRLWSFELNAKGGADAFTEVFSVGTPNPPEKCKKMDFTFADPDEAQDAADAFAHLLKLIDKK